MMRILPSSNCKSTKYLFSIFISAVCFSIPPVAKSRPAQYLKKSAPTRPVKLSEVKSKMGLLVGLYKVEVYIRSWGNGPANPTEERGVQSAFKWLRLSRNGTFKTNPMNGRRIEGKYSFNSKTQTITWNIKSKHQDYIEANLTADFLSNKQGEKIITWDYMGGELGGRIRCRWVSL